MNRWECIRSSSGRGSLVGEHRQNPLSSTSVSLSHCTIYTQWLMQTCKSWTEWGPTDKTVKHPESEASTRFNKTWQRKRKGKVSIVQFSRRRRKRHPAPQLTPWWHLLATHGRPRLSCSNTGDQPGLNRCTRPALKSLAKNWLSGTRRPQFPRAECGERRDKGGNPASRQRWGKHGEGREKQERNEWRGTCACPHPRWERGSTTPWQPEDRGQERRRLKWRSLAYFRIRIKNLRGDNTTWKTHENSFRKGKKNPQ